MHYTDGIETPRLITRFVTEADIPVWLEYCADPVATQFTSIEGKTPEELAIFFVERSIARYKEGLGGGQALISKETGELVGLCGLIAQEVNGKQEIEIGYHLLRRYWGKGYATEAAMAFRDYGFEKNVAGSLISLIDPKNEASKRVAERNGMTLTVRSVLFRDQPINVFRITRKEWERLKKQEV